MMSSLFIICFYCIFYLSGFKPELMLRNMWEQAVSLTAVNVLLLKTRPTAIILDTFLSDHRLEHRRSGLQYPRSGGREAGPYLWSHICTGLQTVRSPHRAPAPGPLLSHCRYSGHWLAGSSRQTVYCCTAEAGQTCPPGLHSSPRVK